MTTNPIQNQRAKEIYEEMKPKPKVVDTTFPRNKRMYVVKLNKFLMDHLKNNPDNATEIFFNGVGELSKIILKGETYHKVYNMKESESKRDTSFHLFKQHANSFKLVGTAKHFLKPIVCEEESRDIETKKKKKMVIEDDEDENEREETRQYPTFVETRERQQEKDKRVRGDIGLLREEIIELFRVKDRYTLKELNQTLDQPPAFLKSVLEDLCDLVDSLTGKGKEWVLKDSMKINYSSK